MRSIRCLTFLLVLTLAFPAGLRAAEQFDYAPLNRVLSSYVNSNGKVNYRKLKQNRADLDGMIEQIVRVSPDSAQELFPTREEKLAYWINAYNAWILRIVVDKYPISSITKTGTIPYGAFFIKRVTLGGKKMTLRSLENDIIRGRFHDPRIHFAINCASISCPPLAPQSYEPQTLDRQLDEAARAFINDNNNVTLDQKAHKIVLSKIFDWYDSDFKDAAAKQGKKDAKVLDYLRQYLSPERVKTLDQLQDAPVSFYGYDWGLNDNAGE